MESVLMGEILQVAGLDIKAIVINIEEEGIKSNNFKRWRYC